jgi:metallophosphoesterase (TIGR00282 family)
VNILVIGDIIGSPGRTAVASLLPDIVKYYNIDFIVANGENAAGGFGLTPAIADELLNYGINVITSGNHIWDKKEIYEYLDETNRVIRPANYSDNVPGKGYTIAELPNGMKIAVISLAGRVFLTPTDCPFKKVDSLLKDIAGKASIILVDFHAEATAEKVAMGWYLDGRVSVIFGTHTHVQTADERILPKGTAYITDVGMCGPKDSVIGIEPDIIINKFLTQMPMRFKIARGDIVFNAMVINIDDMTCKAESIIRLNQISPNFSSDENENS